MSFIRFVEKLGDYFTAVGSDPGACHLFHQLQYLFYRFSLIFIQYRIPLWNILTQQSENAEYYFV